MLLVVMDDVFVRCVNAVWAFHVRMLVCVEICIYVRSIFFFFVFHRM